LLRHFVILPLAIYPVFSFAQLSQIGSGISSDGSPSSARFYVGARASSGEYTNRFSSQDRLTVDAEIAVESVHVGRTGRLFVVAEANGELFLQAPSGSFQAWDGGVSSLVANSEEATLLETKNLAIFSDFSLAPLDAAGLQLNIFLGYSVSNAADTIIYSSTPFQIEIEEYQPLATAAENFQTFDIITIDENRERELPTLVYLPESTEPAAVILFSHGLGGSRFAATYLFEHFASRGYVVVSMQHPGSDVSIYQGVPTSQLLTAAFGAATVENLILRIGDVSSVIDQLEVWNSDLEHVLYRSMDLERIGMSGHSFGARTTQVTSGEIVSYLNYSTLEPRIKAAIPYSTSVPNTEQAAEALEGVNIPWLVMTATNDTVAVSSATVADRLKVFPALPSGDKYELVLFGGEHNAFVNNSNPDSENYNPAHHVTITALSTAFWDAYLLGNRSAKSWLQGEGANAILSEGDTWKFK